jgi:hypothetical protein
MPDIDVAHRDDEAQPQPLQHELLAKWPSPCLLQSLQRIHRPMLQWR